jgi:hypothetical protein
LLKILAGDLSATWNIDGRHFDRYVERRVSVAQSLCDQLLLHDQILIPTQDYATLAGLIRIFGERNVLTLLGEERLAFVRLRGFFGYVRGTGPDGRLVGMEDPTRKRPNSAPTQQSIEAGLSLIQEGITESQRIRNAAYACTTELELGTVVDAVHKDAYADLSQSSLWRADYDFPNPDLLALPGMQEMQVRVIGPGIDVSKNVVDQCLALGLMNVELYLASRFDCVSSATGSPLNDCISLKLPRLINNQPRSRELWNFLEFSNIPNIADPLLVDRDAMTKFIKLTRSHDAQEFRRWFHENANLTERDLVKAYIELLHETPQIQGAGGRSLRMAASVGLSALGLGLVGDVVTSAIDNFVIDKFVRKSGTKFFLEEFMKFSGRIKSSRP